MGGRAGTCVQPLADGRPDGRGCAGADGSVAHVPTRKGWTTAGSTSWAAGGFLFPYLQARTRITLALFITEDIQRAALPAGTVAVANDAGITAEARSIGAAGARIGTPLGEEPTDAGTAISLGKPHRRGR